MKPKRKRDFTGMFIMAVLLSFILPPGKSFRLATL